MGGEATSPEPTIGVASGDFSTLGAGARSPQPAMVTANKMQLNCDSDFMEFPLRRAVRDPKGSASVLLRGHTASGVPSPRGLAMREVVRQGIGMNRRFDRARHRVGILPAGRVL